LNRKNTVVIADDNDQFRIMLKEYINMQKDLEVIATAGDGCEALKKIKKTIPDIIILDIIMPCLDGLAVLENLNVFSMEKKPIIIVFSAVGQSRITEKAISLGATYYIMKPFDIEVLLDRIRYLLEESPENLPNGIDNIEIHQRKNSPRERTLENEITKLVCRFGIPAHLKGYRYIREAIINTLSDQTIWNNTTKELYIKISEKYSTTPMSVERAIRHAIEIGIQKGNLSIINKELRYSNNVKSKPTNKEFILMFSDKIRVDFPDLLP
jgi:two-component system response regulator (stage 0 sporulation protein A)